MRTVPAGAAALALSLVIAACGSEPPAAPTAPHPPTPPATVVTLPSPTAPAAPIAPTAAPQPVPTAAPIPTIAPPPLPAPPPTPEPPPSPPPTLTPAATATPEPGPEIEAAASFGECDFLLEVANSPEERSIGLMNRESLGQDRGMLFVFEQEQILGFWMKNTLIPLDIIFIDSSNVVVDVQTMRPEHEIAPEPLPIHQSAGPALYAIEVNEGVAAECGIEPGDKVTLVNLTPGAPP